MDQASTSSHKARTFFLTITIGCGLFVFLVFIAMLVYPGGSVDDHSSPGYSLSHSFLSTLGMVTSLSGQPNYVSALLFFLALSTAGACLVIFFILFPHLFTRSRLQHGLAVVGSALGVLAGISFVGIAFTPADLARPAHVQFVIWAFRLFPLAVLLYVPVLFYDRDYSRRYAWVFAIFCLLLIAYYLLMTEGPSFDSSQGLVVQVIGQKVIALASILSIGIQSWGAYTYLSP